VGADSAIVCFRPPSNDSTYEFCIRATDDCHTRTETFFVTFTPTSLCTLCVDLSIVGPDCTPVGQEVAVDLVANTIRPIGGFDLLINYDPSALAFLSATIGDAIPSWEFFTFRQGPFDNCGGCPSGLLRIIGIADINDGNNHPNSEDFVPQGVLATIRFRIANDQNLASQFVPVNFYWNDCGDNTFSDPTGNFLYIDNRIFSAENALIWDESDDVLFPENARIRGLGAPDDPCLSGDKLIPLRCADFFNGGVCIIHPDSIDDRGDLNLNGIAYEVADAVLYTNYFIVGLSVFKISVDGQTAASDVNADGITLTIADLVHLIRVVVGDASPIPKQTPYRPGNAEIMGEWIDGNYVVSSRSELELGAALLTFIVPDGDLDTVVIGSGAEGMELAYSVKDGLVRALIYGSPSGSSGQSRISAGNANLITVRTFSGDQSQIELISAEMSDYNGWYVINAEILNKVIPDKFHVSQNFPNPFNPSTTIEISLPQKSHWSLTIHNLLGQKVRTYEGNAEAGIVRLVWDGADSNRRHVASGIYFYSVKAGGNIVTKKMALLR
ncbi:MAG: T9SS type A sorting domain-containing protein, partial [candidate division Zixibacteria bacterium]|nr:T9SS type A sorting domain-containing protein [candidate division Zixibacteria bacterium]